MNFISITFFLFIIGTVLLYYFLPVKTRIYILFLANTFFLSSFGIKNVLLLVCITIISHFCGQFLYRHRNKSLFVFSIILVSAPLILFKYSEFFIRNTNKITSLFNFSLQSDMITSLLAPVGISFYTFRVISYLSDLYTGKLKQPYSLFYYYLYISFFPTLISGPIDRSEDFISQLYQKHILDISLFREAFYQILYGYMQKYIIADRLALIVNSIFGDYGSYTSFQLFVTSIFYTIQIYCDFAGYTNIALGTARLMGFSCTSNFMQPYFAGSIKDFWRRWHISLSSWLRDYIYIPLGGNRKGTFRKYLNLMITFLFSGLWHGVGWKFIIWGALHGFYQITGDLTSSFRTRLKKELKLSGTLMETVIGIAVTFLLINFSWIFFWGTSFSASLHIARNLFCLSPVSFSWLTQLSIAPIEYIVLSLCIILVLITDICSEKDFCIFKGVSHLPLILRWALLMTGILAVLLFGVYGPGFNSAQFIYFQF